jgi:hypothetical protein
MHRSPSTGAFKYMPTTFAKRQKEKDRQDRRRDKEQKRNERRLKPSDAKPKDGEDPDIAGIVPGPQPLPEEFGP